MSVNAVVQLICTARAEMAIHNRVTNGRLFIAVVVVVLLSVVLLLRGGVAWYTKCCNNELRNDANASDGS